MLWIALIALGITVAYGIVVSPLAGVAVAGGVIIVLLTIAMPWSVVALLLALTPFRILWWGAGGIEPLELAYSLTFLFLMIRWGVQYITDKAVGKTIGEETRGVSSPLLWPLLLLFIATLASAYLGIRDNRPIAAWGSHLNLISYFALYFVVVGSLSLKDVNRIFAVLFVVSTIAVIRGIFYRLITEPATIHLMGASVPKISMASSAGLIMFMMVASFALIMRDWKLKLFYGAATIFFGLLQVFAFVRSKWIGAIGGLLFLFLVVSPANKMRFLRWGAIALLVILIYVHTCSMFSSENLLLRLPSVIEQRFLSILKPTEEPTALTRFSEWEAVMKKIKEHPLIGSGLGTKVAFVRYDKSKQPIEISHYIHNAYLFYYLNTGLLGIIAILWLSIAFIWYGLRVARTTEQDYYKAFALGSVAAFFALIMGAVVLIDRLKDSREVS